MKYKINFKEELKKVLFPLDKTKIVIILVGIIPIIMAMLILIVSTSWYEDFPSEGRLPYLITYIFISLILSIIVWLIIVVNVLCRHVLSKFFNNFKGEFEKRFSYGFRILVIGFIIGTIYDLLEFIPANISFQSFLSGSFEDGMFGIIVTTIYGIGNILISLYILYGFLILISAVKYYKPTKISSTESAPNRRARTSAEDIKHG